MTNKIHTLSSQNLSFGDSLFSTVNRVLFPIELGKKRQLFPMKGAVASLWLASLESCTLDDLNKRLKVVVTQDQNQLNQMATELSFFGVEAFVFPDWEILAYDELSPHQDIVSERIALLANMPKSGVLLISIQTLMQRLAPPTWLIGRHFDWHVGDRFDLHAERERLIRAGYRSVDNVFEPGEFAIRGSVIDVFAVGQPLPLRLDLFDDEIETIRFFNPKTQRTLNQESLQKILTQESDWVIDKNVLNQLPDLDKPIESFQLLPAKEFPLKLGKDMFRANFANLFPNSSGRKFELYQDVMAGIASSGVEFYQPLFFDQTLWQESGDFFAYLPDNTLFVLDENLAKSQADYWTQIQRRYQERRYDVDKPILDPKLLYLPEDRLNHKLKQFSRIVLQKGDEENGDQIKSTKAAKYAVQLRVEDPPNLPVNHRDSEPLQALLDFVKAQSSTPILLVAETAGRREVLLELLKNKLRIKSFDRFADFMANLADLSEGSDESGLPVVGLAVAPIEQGVFLPDQVILISETQLFGRQVLQVRRRRQSDVSEEFLVKSVTEMTVGSPVVHIEHGIGRYQGLAILDVGDGEQEFIHLKYADDASVYVPVANLHLISRYNGGESVAAPLHKLGNGKWEKAKQKVLEQIHDVAAELLNTQARRNAKTGIAFSIDMAQYELFASQFAFEETPDQSAAIYAVMQDMKQNRPMDRLICGDVGFGKTEVAMRAAFIAVNAGYQVAVLVPTTLLAGQHEDNFLDRFADWPIRVESLSRFGGKKHQEQVLADLQAGKIDIVIGTHKLLQENVKFARLGLMIVDEEHRFGVRQKERIKAIQSDVDSLSMTATPIPRTLNMAFVGLRDMSNIQTPPARRLAVKTFVMQKSDSLLKEAILRELFRGGQVYLVHNDVASIERMAESVRELVPEARVGVAHGQMNERQLEQVMQQFYHKKYNILVCTTIIETGIDVPNANTIIIERADKFGLAQLHQLRGRVGRSHHQAYCYLLVPSIKGLKGDAKKRLTAIEKANTLGAGFMLASEDLEIRGAGEILGKQQSGNIQAIGISLYTQMLDRATKAIKAGKQPDLNTPLLSLTSDINLHCPALIPETYLHDVHQRLLFYKRISNADTQDTLTDLRTELIDRFGALPIETQHLFAIHQLRLMADQLAIRKIDANGQNITLEFLPTTPVEALTIIHLIQTHPECYRMKGATSLIYTHPKPLGQAQQRIDSTHQLLNHFISSLHKNKADSP